MADRDKLASVENSLVQRYNERGFLLEDEVIDCCVDHNLDLAEIDAVCDRLLKQNIIFRDSESTTISDDDDDDVYDRSHLDYDEIFEKIALEYPNVRGLIEEIRSILPPQHKEWRTLIREAQADNAFAKERLIQMYLRTMLKQSYDFAKSYNCDFEDCFQNAVLGFISAVKKYDVTSPDSFVSYFPLWARQVMYRDCVISGTILRFPVHYKDQLISAVNSLNNTEISVDHVGKTDWYIIQKHEESGEYSGVYKEIEGAFSSLYMEEYEEISKDVFDYNHLVPYLPLVDDVLYEDDFEERIFLAERNRKVREIVNSCLRDRERDVIVKRYGLDDGKSRTLEEVGDILGVTRERIRQIESKALKKLHKHCEKLL